jgi:cobalt-zinc-cadmium efflux system outer membrane protein
MRLKRTAVTAAMCLWCASPWAQQPGTLTLEEAFTRVIARNPDLARFRYSREGAQAEVDEAAQRPEFRAGIESENWPGTGSKSGPGEAQVTLSLASVLELGGKRAARVEVAGARLDGLTLKEEARRLDLLAEVARRFLDLLAGQYLVEIAEADLSQREKVVQAASQRVRAGASPDSVRLMAEAAVSRAKLRRNRAQAQTRAVARSLAALWNDRSANFDRAAGDPLVPFAVPSLDALSALLEDNPQLRQFADERRLREARVQLARSASTPDIEWQAGVRRLESTKEWTAVLGVSIPLGARARAQPRVKAAQAELAALSLEHESEEITLYETLIDAHARVMAARDEADLVRTDLLPRLGQAEQAAERAYRAGALSYLEWAQLQSDTTTARQEQLEAAIEAHRALIEIQRLTGQSFNAAEFTTFAESSP